MNNIDKQIEKVKRELASKFISLLGIIMITYFFYDFYIFKDKPTAYYMLAGCFLIIYTWIIVRKSYKLEKIVHVFFNIAPIYYSFILLRSWNGSLAGFVWIIFLPFGAYIFFSRKEIIYYIFYTIIYIFLIAIISYYLGFHDERSFKYLDRNKIIVSDMILFIFYSFIIAFAVYYNDKIRDLSLLSKIEKTGINVSKLVYNDKEIQKLEDIFIQLENVMKREKLYKDSNFNISKMSVHINVNSGYISKSIRYKEFTNFNSYLNKYRIDYAKELMQNIDYQKLTLLYVYSESGFANQVTFNRVFKQIEGVTPTEYIDNLRT